MRIFLLFFIIWISWIEGSDSFQKRNDLFVKNKIISKKNDSNWKGNVSLKTIRVVASDGPLRTISNNVFASNNPVIENGTLRFIFSSILTGLITSLLVLLCKHGIIMIDKKVRQRYPIATPLLASIVIGALSLLESKAAVPVIDGVDQPAQNVLRRLWIRIVGFIVSIGSGFSVGLAGPAAEIGMAIASVVNSIFLPISNNRAIEAESLILAGSAAGLAINFNTPLTGLVFSSEVSSRGLNATESANKLIYRFIAIASALIVLRRYAIFQLPVTNFQYQVFHSTNAPDFLTQIGILSGLGFFSAVLYNGIDRLKRLISKFYQLLKVPSYLKPLFAGIICSFAASQSVPQTLSAGFATTNQILNSGIDFHTSLKFLLFKIHSFSWCNVSNIIGGIFAPIFFLGVGAGSVYTHLLNRWLPITKALNYLSVLPVLSGAALLSCQYNSLLLPLVFVLEMTQSFQLALPLLITLVVSSLSLQLIRSIQSSAASSLKAI